MTKPTRVGETDVVAEAARRNRARLGVADDAPSASSGDAGLGEGLALLKSIARHQAAIEAAQQRQIEILMGIGKVLKQIRDAGGPAAAARGSARSTAPQREEPEEEAPKKTHKDIVVPFTAFDPSTIHDEIGFGKHERKFLRDIVTNKGMRRWATYILDSEVAENGPEVRSWRKPKGKKLAWALVHGERALDQAGDSGFPDTRINRQEFDDDLPF